MTEAEAKEIIPQGAIDKLEELRRLEGEYTDLSYRMGTNGERGLYPKRKSVLSKIGKAKQSFNITYNPNFSLAYSHNWPNWFIRINENPTICTQ